MAGRSFEVEGVCPAGLEPEVEAQTPARRETQVGVSPALTALGCWSLACPPTYWTMSSSDDKSRMISSSISIVQGVNFQSLISMA